jgi:ABC-2 type transport system ATP-binding protein
MHSNVVIRTWGLTRRFGKTTAVDGPTMEVPRCEVFGFLGPNGADKTTTIAMLLGRVRRSAGWAAQPVGEAMPRGRQQSESSVPMDRAP